MQAIDKYLATAITYIKEEKNQLLFKGLVPKVYKGYVASFGTIIKQSGLLPAVVLFSKKDSANGNPSKEPILKAIFHLLKKNSGLKISENQDIIDFAISSKDANSAAARREMLNAAIALKLALRTFKFESNE